MDRRVARSAAVDAPGLTNGPAHFVFIVDTEGDDEWTILRRVPPLRNLRALPRFQALCERFGMRPTYVVTHTVTRDAEAVAMLSEWARAGRCEVGAHLHPWTTPPWSSCDDSPAFPCELSDALLARKLRALTEAITEAFARAPTSFRAGRFGADGRTLSLLAELGYVCDSSVTPLLSWRSFPGLAGGGGGPDFSRAPLAPYRPAAADISTPGSLPIVEVPASVVRRERGPRALGRALDHPGVGARVRQAASWLGLRRQVWLRPSLESPADMVDACAEIRARGCPIFNMMLHSSELFPNTSPYARSQREVDALLDRTARALEGIRARFDPAGLTLTEAARRALPTLPSPTE